jgi:hypothetical protein
MNIAIKTSDNKKSNCNICFDRYGNLYFKVDNRMYQVNIDGQNRPYADLGKYSEINKQFLDKDVKYNTFKLSHKELLKNKINDELEEDIRDDEDVISDTEELAIESDSIIYEEIENKYGVHNKPFGFSYVDPNYEIPVDYRENGDIIALYDTYVYDKDSLCFKSYSREEESIYELKIFSGGSVGFKPTGNPERSYELVYNKENGELNFV